MAVEKAVDRSGKHCGRRFASGVDGQHAVGHDLV